MDGQTMKNINGRKICDILVRPSQGEGEDVEQCLLPWNGWKETYVSYLEYYTFESLAPTSLKE